MKTLLSDIGQWSARQWTAAIGISLLAMVLPLSHLQLPQFDQAQSMIALVAVLNRPGF